MGGRQGHAEVPHQHDLVRVAGSPYHGCSYDPAPVPADDPATTASASWKPLGKPARRSCCRYAGTCGWVERSLRMVHRGHGRHCRCALRWWGYLRAPAGARARGKGSGGRAVINRRGRPRGQLPVDVVQTTTGPPLQLVKQRASHVGTDAPHLVGDARLMLLGPCYEHISDTRRVDVCLWLMRPSVRAGCTCAASSPPRRPPQASAAPSS